MVYYRIKMLGLICILSVLLAATGYFIITSKTPTALLKIIDAHVHVDFEGGGNPDEEWEKFKVEAEKNHVVGAVSHSPRSKPVPNQKGPEVLRVCAAITQEVTVEVVEKSLQDGRCVCLKVYLGYVPLPASDPRYQPFYRLAEKYSVPVVFHTGDTYVKSAKLKYADPLTVDEVAVDYPMVKFVLAHMGNPWFQSAAEVVYKNDNVYTDTSGILLGDVSKTDSESVEKLLIEQIRWFYLYVENPKKILFGTDWPLVSIGAYVRAVQRAIPRQDWGKVFYSNAAEVFGFERTAEKHAFIFSPGGVGNPRL